MNAGTRRTSTCDTLLSTWASATDMSPAIRVAAVFLIATATAVGAQISVPLGFTPVPLVMGDMVVLLGGAALGSRLGMAAQVAYLAAGIAGLPVFAASATLPQGPLRLLGPTGGYLMAYPFAAFLTGYLAERGFDRRYATCVLAMAAGYVLIFTGGVTWLALFGPAALGFDAALRAGLYPFMLGGVCKLLLGAGVLPGVWKLVGKS